jgi:phosphoglucomutase
MTSTPKPIAFGTSGWRGIIAEDFTFPRLRLVSRAVGLYLKSSGQAGKGVCVAHDTRFLSEHFASEAARVLEAEGIAVTCSTTHVPTPAISHFVRERDLGGAINITASHNPAVWSGFKFNNHQGAPAPPDTTRAIEANVAELLKDPGEDFFAKEKVAIHHAHGEAANDSAVDENFFESYFEALSAIVKFDRIKASGITVAVDPLWGAGRGYMAEMLRRHSIPIVLIHDERDVQFGGLGPDPEGKYLGELGALVKEGKAKLGLAMDGDADRFGIVDSDGKPVSANLILALLADYLAESRGWRHGLARSYATTGLMDAVAKHYDMPLNQTPVGFKYLGQLILEGKAFLAGEESAGMSVAGHVPEKDGLIAGLLVAEMVAERGKSLAEQAEELFSKVGRLVSGREDTPVTPTQVARLKEKMADPPGSVGGRIVSKATVLDGLRLDFGDGEWLLMRPSGTEPVVRYYVEARSGDDLARLIKDGREALLG